MTIPAWIPKIVPLFKALAVMAACVGAGLALAGWLRLPGQVGELAGMVETNTRDIAEIQRTHSTLVGRIDRMICLQLLLEDGNPLSCP